MFMMTLEGARLFMSIMRLNTMLLNIHAVIPPSNLHPANISTVPSVLPLPLCAPPLSSLLPSSLPYLYS